MTLVIARRLIVPLCLLAGVLSAGAHAALATSDQGTIEVIPIHGTIDEGMSHMVTRAVAQANADHARAIVLDVNTFGGLVQAGTEIRDALLGSEVPVDAYVVRAWSAGALISLAASRIVVEDGGSIGSAQPIPHDPKTVSALRAEFRSTAARFHRSSTLAAAMVDTSVDAPVAGLMV